MRREPAATGAPWFTSALTGAGGAGEVLILSRDDVLRCLERVDVVEVVREALAEHDRGRCLLPGEAYLQWRNANGAYTRSIAMPGGLVPETGPARYGLKVVNASVSNPSIGLERAAGLGLCFDPETARVTAIIEVGLLSALRTAAVSLVGIEVAGRPHAGSLSVVGTGMQGSMHTFLLLDRLATLRRVALFDRDAAAAAALARRIGAAGSSADVVLGESAESTIRGADLVVLTTTADEGYVQPHWIAPGALVVNVSLGDLTDAALLRSAALYVDSVELVRENPRRPLGRLIQAGLIGVPDSAGGAGKRIDGTIGGLLTGRCRATPPGQSYTVLNPFGMGVLDVALLHAVSRAAVTAGVGTGLRLG